MANNADKDVADGLEKIRSDIASLSATVAQLASDGADMRSALKKKVNATARQAAAAGEDLLGEASDMAHQAFASAGKSASAMVDNVEGQIVRNPMMAVVAALGVGFVFGLMSRK